MRGTSWWGRSWIPLYERLSPRAWTAIPRPPMHQVVYGAGPSPDHILLAGGSSAVGFGVFDHELGLAGHLARSVAGVTGRGTAVEVVGNPRLTIRTIESALTPVRLDRADLLVLTIGTREAFEFLSPRSWSDALAALLDRLLDRSSPAIVVVGAEETSPVPLPLWLTRRAMSRAAALNAASRDVIARRHGVEFVDSGLVAKDDRRGLYDVDKAELYTRAARALTPTVSAILDRLDRTATHPVDEAPRLGAVAQIRNRRAEVDAELRQLVDNLRNVLAVADAALAVVDRDEVWPIVPDVEGSGPRPRARSLSDATLQHRSLSVRDLTANTLFEGIGTTGPRRIRAYASHVVPSPDDLPVAVLAVGDPQPRDFTESDRAILREFALRAGAVLYRDRPATPTTGGP